MYCSVSYTEAAPKPLQALSAIDVIDEHDDTFRRAADRRISAVSDRRQQDVPPVLLLELVVQESIHRFMHRPRLSVRRRCLAAML